MRYLILIFFIVVLNVNAQVGINTTTPDPSSMLDITATDKGMLIPRMTEAQRTAITTPATGLLVYQTDNTDGFWYFNGVSWLSLSGGADNDWTIVGSDLEAAVTGSVTASEMQIGNTGRGTGFGGIYNKDVTSQTTDYALLQNDNGTTYLNSGGGNALHFRTDNTEHMTMLNNGKVGIGTNNPSSKLSIITSEDRALESFTGPSGGPSGPITDVDASSYPNPAASNSWSSSVPQSQSFLISTSGVITYRVTYRVPSGTALVNVSLHDGSNSSAPIIETINNVSFTGFGNQSISFSSIVTAGTTYTVSFSVVSGVFEIWNTTNSNHYPDGEAGIGGDGRFLVIINNPIGSILLHRSSGFGINRMNPNASLDVNGRIRYTDGNESSGKVLTCDAIGYASWQTPANGGEFQSISGVVQNTTDIVNDDFVFGSTSLADIVGTDDDNRVFFDKSKGAFRAGSAQGTEWDDANVGDKSVALGYNNMASGNFSTAMGRNTTALGFNSTALGYQTAASGGYSTAMGYGTIAPSYGETTLGLFSEYYIANSASGINATDRLFVVANGTSTTARSNALTILKNGHTGIGTSSPDVELHVAGQFKLVDGTQGAGKVLTSSGTGLASWQDASALDDGDWTVSGSNLVAGVSGSVTASEALISNTGRGLTFAGFSNKDVPSQTTDYALLQSDAGETFLNSGGGNDLHFRTDNTEQVTILNNGNVGIGTATPIKKLDVLTGTSGEGIVIRSSTTASNVAGHFFPGTNGFVIDSRLGDLTGAKNFHIRTGGTDRIFVSGGTGNVGIGTANPTQAKLVVSGSASNALSYGYLNSSGATGTASGSNAYSIHASNRISAQEFNAFSDVRIKNIQGISNSEKDLETLAKIEITDYQLKDTIARGNKAFKKVIAQQVKKVYPQAVTDDLTDVIPNIYKLSEIKDSVIALSADLTVGDKVKLIFSEGEELVDVTEVTENSFKVATKKQGKVFVYGKLVDDFHTVDYEAISMLNVSATQELLKRIKQLENQNKELIKDNNELSSSILNLENRFSRLESFLLKESTEVINAEN